MQKIASQGQYRKLLDLSYRSLEEVMENAYDSATGLRNRAGGRIFKSRNEEARSLAASLAIPKPDYSAFKEELLAATPGRNIEYRYLSAITSRTVRHDDMYLARFKGDEDVILVSPETAWDMEQYIKRIYDSKIKSELYRGDPSKEFKTCAPERHPVVPVSLVTVHRGKTLERFRQGFRDRKKPEAVSLISLLSDSPYAEKDPDHNTPTRTQNIMNELSNTLTEKKGKFVYRGKPLKTSDFFVEKDDIWIGGSSRTTLERYFSDLNDIEPIRAHFVQGGLPGHGRRH